MRVSSPTLPHYPWFENYSMLQKSCINMLFAKAVIWNFLMNTQVFKVLRIIGKILSPAVPLMIKGCKHTVLLPDLEELCKISSPLSKFCKYRWHHLTIVTYSEKQKVKVIHYIFTVDTSCVFADLIEFHVTAVST